MYIIEQPHGAVLLSTHNVWVDSMLCVFKNNIMRWLSSAHNLFRAKKSGISSCFCCDVDQFWLESMLSNGTHFVDYEGQNIYFIRYWS